MFLEGEEEMHFVDEEFLYVRDCPGGLPIELWYLPLLCFLRSSLGGSGPTVQRCGHRNGIPGYCSGHEVARKGEGDVGSTESKALSEVAH